MWILAAVTELKIVQSPNLRIVEFLEIRKFVNPKTRSIPEKIRPFHLMPSTAIDDVCSQLLYL